MMLGVILAVLQSFAPAQGKKLVALGWEFIYTSPTEIAEHADSYRGTGISGGVFNLFGTLPDGTRLNTNRLPEDPAWTREAFAADEAALKKLTQLPEFQFSFIDAVRCPRKRHAWTDDAFWSDYVNKVRIVAAIAHDTGMVGLSVDNEDYGRCKQFYFQNDDGDFDSVAKLARQRGCEIFSAIFAEFPNARIHFDRLYANELWNYYYGADDPRAVVRARGDLWVHFLDGALEALPPTGVFYEGDESGYRYDSVFHDALESRSRNLLDLARVAAPELREKYRAQVRLALPIYMDRYEGQKPGSRYWLDPIGGSLVAKFERNLHDALVASDDYVWLYTEASYFGRWQRDPKEKRNSRAPHPTWEERIPGMTDILNSMQHPREFAERRINELKTSGKLRNLLPSRLNPWQAKEQPGTINEKDGIWFAEGVGRGGISWSSRDVKEGDRYAITFEVRGKMGTSQVNFHRKGGAHDLTFPVPRVFAPPAGSENDWCRQTFIVRVPESVESLLVSLNFAQQSDERVEFRNIGFYRLLRVDCQVPNPQAVTVVGEGFNEELTLCDDVWMGEKTSVRLVEGVDGTTVKVTAPGVALRDVIIRWDVDFGSVERSRVQDYVLVDRGDRADSWGVKKRSNSSVTWQVSPKSIEAVLDVRVDGNGIRLGKRVLDAAVLVRRDGIPGEPAEIALRSFERMR